VSDFIQLPTESGIHANFQFIQYIEYNGQIFTQTLVKCNEGCACLPKVITGIIRGSWKKMYLNGERRAVGNRTPKFSSQFCYCLAVCPLARSVASLFLTSATLKSKYNAPYKSVPLRDDVTLN